MVPGRSSFLILFAAAIGLFIHSPPGSAQGDTASTSKPAPHIRVIIDDFVLQGRLGKLASIALESGLSLDYRYVESASGDPKDWLVGADLVILDTPRPMDVAKVEQRVGSALRESQVPWVRIGGGPPAFGNLPPHQARPLISYYANGGEANARAMFAFIKAWRSGSDAGAIPPPAVLPTIGFYHPDAPHVFGALEDYMKWGATRWIENAPRMAIAIHSGLVSGMETQVVDALVSAGETRGLSPIAFWFDTADPQGLEKAIGAANPDVLIIATHLQNGPARAAEFLRLDIPVLQTVSYRDGKADDWRNRKAVCRNGSLHRFSRCPRPGASATRS